MGKIDEIAYEALIEEQPDRFANFVRVYRSPNGEVTIHFRNIKIVLLTDEDIREWRDGMRAAQTKFLEGDYFKQDV